MSHNHTECIDYKENVHIFYIGFDLLDDGPKGQVHEKFGEELFDDIPAFAFGTDICNEKVNKKGLVPTVREAMKNIYAIPEIQAAQEEYLNSENTEDKYIKRGEFGELMLYHLLHEYFEADALISKIYFKDSPSIAAHGFDAVHVDLSTKSLWLGESKLYQDGNKAINALIEDVKEHFTRSFFDSEFQIITNRVHDRNVKYSPFIQKLIDPNTKVLDKLANINIALFAAFNSSIIKNSEVDTLKEKLCLEIDKLVKRAQNGLTAHPWHENLHVYLLLFPLADKREFVSMLHQKLKGAQQI
jgi:hypothetical protein